MVALRLAVLAACLALASAIAPVYPPTYSPSPEPAEWPLRRSAMEVPVYPPIYPSPVPTPYRRSAMDTTESTATIQTAVDTTTTATAAAVPKTPAVQATATATGAKAPEAEAISFLPSFEHSCKNFHALPAEVGNTDNQRFNANLLFMSRTVEEFDLARCFKQAGLLVRALGLKFAGVRSGRECWAVWEAPPERILASTLCQPCANPDFADSMCGGTGSMTLYTPLVAEPKP